MSRPMPGPIPETMATRSASSTSASSRHLRSLEVRGCPRALGGPGSPRGLRLATLAGRFLAAAEKAGQQLVERDQVVGASRVDQRGREADGPILASRHEDRGGRWVTGAELGGDSAGLTRRKIEVQHDDRRPHERKELLGLLR